MITFQQHSRFLIPVIVALLALLAFVFNNHVAFFDYDKVKILNGELWRIVTGHLFHTNGYHLLLNLAGLTLLTAIHKQFYTIKSYVLLFLGCAVIISIIMLYFSSLERYVGLSGILHGIFAWGALKDIQHKENTGYLLFLGLWVKIVMEQINGASNDVSSLIEATVAIDAHLYGAAVGSLFFLLQTWMLKRTKE
ncbi:rhombosortase [Thalassotalea euphylliae]|uniref:rhombosortase n=1 Tax=Thalassotalea euphylliae TaxID=1655234 RepID=UPI00363D39F2